MYITLLYTITCYSCKWISKIKQYIVNKLTTPPPDSPQNHVSKAATSNLYISWYAVPSHYCKTQLSATLNIKQLIHLPPPPRPPDSYMKRCYTKSIYAHDNQHHYISLYPTFNKIGHHTADKLTTPTLDPQQNHTLKALKSKLHTFHDNLCLTLF